MKFSVSTLGRAEADIGRIYAWIADRSAQGASKWYNAAREAIDELARDAHQHELAPESCALVRDIRQRLFKTRRGRSYRLLYTIVGRDVRVLRVRGPGQAPVTVEDVSE